MLEFQENFTLYKLPDISHKASEKEINKKIRKIYINLHPDKNKSSHSDKACFLIGVAKKYCAMKN